MRSATVTACVAAIAIASSGIARSADGVPRPPLKELIEMLDHRDASVRGSGARQLDWRGPEARAAIPKLVRLLNDAGTSMAGLGFHYSVADQAKYALVSIGLESIPALTEALKSGDVFSQRQAADAMWRLGQNARSAIPLLIARAKSKDWQVRVQVLGALAAADPHGKQVVPVLLAALKDKVPAVRAAAATCLGGYDEFGQVVVPALNPLLSDGSKYDFHCGCLFGKLSVAETVAPAIGQLTRWSSLSAPALIRAYRTPRNPAKREVLEALARMGRNAAPIVPDLLRELERDGNDDDVFPETKFLALAQLGAGARAAVPAMRKHFDGKDPWTRICAAGVLASVDKVSRPKAVAFLISQLRDSDKAPTAIKFLEIVGPDAVGAVPELKKYWDRDKDSAVVFPSSEIINIYRSAGPKAAAAIPQLIDHLERDIDNDGTNAALRSIGPAALTALLKKLKGDKPKQYVVASIGTFGQRAEKAVPDLIRLAKSSAGNRKEVVLNALGTIATDPATTLPLLIATLRDKTVTLRVAAARNLAKFGPRAKPAVPQLRKALKDDSADVRVAAMEALTKIALRDAESRRAIAALRGDSHPLVKLVALEALAKMKR